MTKSYRHPQSYNQLPAEAQTADARQSLAERNQWVIDSVPIDRELTDADFEGTDNANG